MKQEYTYPELLDLLYDLKALAVPPAAEERGESSTVHNRACRYNPETDSYENWSVKAGTIQYERMEGDEYVLLDVDGPGVIWRFWSVSVDYGHHQLKVYLDGEEEPALDQSLRDFFRQYSDDYALTNLPNLISAEQSRGNVSYLPIPFNRHIKITAKPVPSYQFTYTLLPQGTRLPDYRQRFTIENNIAEATVNRRLEERGSFDPRKNWVRVTRTVPPGETVLLFRREGVGAIDGIRYYPQIGAAADEAEVLRKLVLRMHWDGREAPAVWSPLGDFFGSAMGIHPFRTLVCGMHRLECYSNWYMPYGNGAAVYVENRTDREQTLTFDISTATLEDEPDRLLRFHAKWHPTEFLDIDQTDFLPDGQRYPDWPLLLVKGAGRFCGMSMHVYNDWRDPVKPADSWWYGKWHPELPYQVSISWFWGEGREKFFVDGEKSPACFGTGSEDYIGYGFSAEPPFCRWDKPFCAETAVPLTGKGHTSHCRFQIADNVPFHDGFQGFIEKYQPDYWQNARNPREHGDLWNCCYFDVICYWYQQAGLDDGYPAYDTEQLYGQYHLPQGRPAV